jgi:purine-binding chemotaxis protein CheW
MSSESGSRDEVVQLAAFRVGTEEYVVDIRRVREIIRVVPITPVRKGPRFVEGVINLRVSVIPIIDLRRRFDLAAEESPQRKIIIMSIEGRILGLMVDAVTEVVRVPRGAIRPAPGLLEAGRAPYFLGVCHYRGRTLVLLNVKNVVASDERIEVPKADALTEGSVSGHHGCVDDHLPLVRGDAAAAPGRRPVGALSLVRRHALPRRSRPGGARRARVGGDLAADRLCPVERGLLAA